MHFSFSVHFPVIYSPNVFDDIDKDGIYSCIFADTRTNTLEVVNMSECLISPKYYFSWPVIWFDGTDHGVFLWSTSAILYIYIYIYIYIVRAKPLVEVYGAAA